MAINDWLYQNLGADDFMRAGRQVGKQGISALGTGDFWQSLGAGALEGGLMFVPGGAVARGALGAAKGAKFLASAGSLRPTVKQTAGNIAGALGVSTLLGGATPAVASPLSAKPFTTPMSVSGQVPIPAPVTPTTITPADVSGVGQGEYRAATGQANSVFNIQKKEAQNRLTDILTGLGQQLSGGSADMAMQAAQAGLDTSPGALDVGIESLATARAAGEMGARANLASTLQKLQLQRAKQMQAAAQARQSAQSSALLSGFTSDLERISAEEQNKQWLAYLRAQGVL